MIKPTIGRVVWFYPSPEYKGTVHASVDGIRGPIPALVCHVWSDRMVNLATFDSNGHSHPVTSVVLIQPEDDFPVLPPYCAWMPYQQGQAAKTEEAIKQLSEATKLL